MKGKKISFVVLFLAVLLTTSFVNFEKDDNILNLKEFNGIAEDDEQILNSKQS